MAASNRTWNEEILANPKTFYTDFLAYEAHRGSCKNLIEVIDEFKDGNLMPGRNLEKIGKTGLLSVRIDRTDRLLIIFYQGYVILQNICLEHDYEGKRVYKEKDNIDKFIRENFPQNEKELKLLEVSEDFLRPYREQNTPQKPLFEQVEPMAPLKSQFEKKWDEDVEVGKALVFVSEKTELALQTFYNKYKLNESISDETPSMLIGATGTGKTHSLLSRLAFQILVHPNDQYLVIAQTPSRVLQMIQIWQDNIGPDWQELPIEFKSVSEVSGQDLSSKVIFIDDGQMIDDVFLNQAMKLDTCFVFNKDYSKTLEKTVSLKKAYYDETKKAVKVIELSQNHRSSPNVLGFIKMINRLAGIAKGELVKDFELLPEPNIVWLDLDEQPNFPNATIVTDEQFLEDARNLFPQASIKTPAQVISSHTPMQRIVLYKPFVSDKALAVDRIIKIQQSPSSSPKIKKSAQLMDSEYFDQLVEVLGLVQQDIVILHSKDDRKKAEALFQGLSPKKELPAVIDEVEEKENIKLESCSKDEKQYVPMLKIIEPCVKQFTEHYSKENLQTLMKHKKLSSYLSQTYSINDTPYRIVEQIQKNNMMFNDFFTILLSRKDIFLKFPSKDFYTEIKKTKIKGDLATIYSGALFNIQALIEKNILKFQSFETPLVSNSLIQTIILFLFVGQQTELLQKFISLVLHLNDKGYIENMVLKIIQQNDTDLFQFLVDMHFDFSGFKKDGKNLLHYAIEFGATKLIEALVGLNVDMHALDETGLKPYEMKIKTNKAQMKVKLEKYVPKEPSELLVDHGLFAQKLDQEFISEVLSQDEFDRLINPSPESGA